MLTTISYKNAEKTHVKIIEYVNGNNGIMQVDKNDVGGGLETGCQFGVAWHSSYMFTT